jgi:hypothetical protein
MTKFLFARRKRAPVDCRLKDEDLCYDFKEDNPDSAGLITELCRENGFVPKCSLCDRTLGEQICSIEAGVGVSILDSYCILRFNPYIKFFEMKAIGIHLL